MVTVTEAPINKALILEDFSGDFCLRAYYNDRNQYMIEITQLSTGNTKSAEITATYEPIWGPDQQDMMEILARAEAMCEEFEEECQKKTTS